MVKMLHCGVAAFSIPLQLLELLWWACCRHVKQTTTLDEKIPIRFLHSSKAFVCLFVLTNGTNVQIVNERTIILEFRLLEPLLQACKADRNECTQVTMDEKFPNDFCLFVLTDIGS